MTVVHIQQILVAIVSSSLLLIALRRARREELTFGLAMAWSSIALLGFVAVAAIPRLDEVGFTLGVTPSALLAGGVAIILSAVALNLSGAVTRQDQQLHDLAESLGLQSISPPLPASSNKASVLAIVPAFNEVRSVGACVSGLRDLGLPVLIVDDGSTDETATVARTAGASVLRLDINLGVGGAIRAGLRAARAHGYRTVIQSDADGQHSAAAVAVLLSSHNEHHSDMTIGSRFLDNETRRNTPFARRTAHSILAALASRRARTRLTDTTSGLRIIQEPLLESLAHWMPRHYLGDTYEVVLEAIRRGYRISEVPVEALPRQFGTSTASVGAATRLTLRCLLVTIIPARRPLRPRPSASS